MLMYVLVGVWVGGEGRGVDPLEPSWETFVYVFHMRVLQQIP